jgi:voltage-gated potassium channel
MIVSVLLLLKFVYDIVKRLIHDAYFRSLGILVLIMAGIGTLFFWLVEGRTFLQALAYSVGTLAMNSPYGHAWGPSTTGGIVFNLVYIFLGVGLFLIFVLEAGKTMVQSYEEFNRKMAERRALRRAKKEAER